MTVYNRIILAMFFYLAVLKIHVASKNLEPITHKQVIKKKTSANVEALPHGYLIIAKQR